MSHFDDDELIYEDDDEYYDDDYSDDVESSKDKSANPFASRTSGLPGASNRFSGGGGISSRLGGNAPINRSPSPSRFGAKDDDSKSSGSRFGGSSPFGKKDDDSKPSGSRFGGSSPFGKKDDDSKPSGNRFGGSSPFGKKDEDSKSSGSRFGGSSSFGKKDDDSKSSGSRFGGSSSFGKKDEDSKSSGNRFGGSFKKAPFAKNNDDKKDEKASTSRFGGSSSFGKKDDDSKPSGNRFGSSSSFGKKDDANKEDSGKSGGSRFGVKAPSFGKKDNANKEDSGKSGGGRFGGRFGKKSGSSDSGDKNAVAAVAAGAGASSAFGSKGKTDKDSKSSGGGRFGGIGGKLSRGGKKDSDSKGDFSANDTKKQSALGAKSADKSSKKDKSGGGFLSRFGLGGGKKSQPKRAKSTKSKAPQIEGQGLTLDNKLDILGVVLVFSSLILFFSAISTEQAAIANVHRFFGELLGWGDWAVPIIMFSVGMWLIIRHFGEDAPTIDPIRVIGLGIFYLSALTLFQFYDAMSYPPGSFDSLNLHLQISREVYQSGGGLVGSTIYLWLVTNIGEIAGFVALLLPIVVSVMFMTRLSASEIAMYVIGIWRSFKTSLERRAQRRRVIAVQRQAALAQQAQSISVSRPANAELASGSAGALPAPSADAPIPVPIEQRDILIRRGGQTLSAGTNEPIPLQVAQQTTVASAQQTKSGGLFSRFRRGNNQQQPAAQIPQAYGSSAKTSASGGILGRLLSGSSNEQQQAQTAPVPAVALTGSQNTAAVAENGQQDTTLGQLLGNQQPIIARNEGATPSQQPAAVQTQLPFGQKAVSQAVPAPSTSQTTEFESPFKKPEPAPPPPPAINIGGKSISPPQPSVATSNGDTKEKANIVADRMSRIDALRQGNTTPSEEVAKVPEQSVAEQARPTPEASVVATPVNGNGSNGVQPPVATSPKPTIQSQPEPTPAPSVSTPLAQPQPTRSQPLSTMPTNQTRQKVDWKVPDYRTLLASGSEQEFDRDRLLEQARVIEETLQSFGAPGRVVEVNTGPVITQFGVEPDYLTARSGKKHRVKVGAIAQLDKDLQLALGAKSIRIEAPVPGKGFVGIEVPNEKPSLVSLRDVMESEEYQEIDSPLAIALGQSVDGSPVVADLAAMPHLLIAGTTGSGKSVCVNSIISSILANNTPERVKLVMVDPKRVELTGYNNVPHLVAPVVVDLERIVGVLKWVTREMDDRYKRFSTAGARNIVDYNESKNPEDPTMPFMVVIIDELADLMMLAPEETERTITRIAALARATGIHLVIATQRPSVDVVTGLIKANFPARIAFAVAGGVDSRVILDQPGAERLLGKGDMLYMSGNSPAPLRLQGVFLSDMEIANITRYWKKQTLEQPVPATVATIGAESRTLSGADVVAFKAPSQTAVAAPPSVAESSKQTSFWDTVTQETGSSSSGGQSNDMDDELYDEAVELIRRLNKASVSLLQRRLRIGYTRAARLIDTMEERGIVGPAQEGSKPRKVLPPKP